MQARFIAIIIIILGITLSTGLIVGCQPPDEQESKAQTTSTTEKKTEEKEEAKAGENDDMGLTDAELEEFARKVIAEQQESRADLRRLIEGDIKEIVIKNVNLENARAVLDITVTYIGEGNVDGQIILNEIVPEKIEDSFYYFSELTRGSPPASTENVGLEEIDLGKKIVEDQFKHQQTLLDLLENKIDKIIIDKVNMDTEEGTVEITVVYKDGTTKQGIIKMAYLNGYWYLVSLEQKS